MSILPLLFVSSICGATTSEGLSYDHALGDKSPAPAAPVVQDRVIKKIGRLHFVAPSFGFTEAHNYQSQMTLAGAVRYHFSETIGIEALRVTRQFISKPEFIQEVLDKTGLVPDSQISNWQLSSALLWTPVYGKYAWNEDSLVYFDLFGIAGAGLRFANDTQPFAEAGLGMNHYLSESHRFALIPEARLRVYSEKRSQSDVTVWESVCTLGISYLY